MLIINKATVNAIKQKLNGSGRTPEVVGDVTRMLDIKKALQWRCEAMTPCCGSFCNITSQINHEIAILEDILTTLEKGNVTRASSLLEEYMQTLEEDRVSG